ncbi:hypothetical protein GWO43_01545 [candidate division KSB1 bacterium]|nr:hypothetical protein [candidate division KSB1 bacterium]NIR69404.1 hypothetical protein [candidate division KSB1 bacterium]NIS22754.1 hypothetical protein [candidate division KSB1 bacterium]NIT69601.1 hypothetical protein [candidate division KSB1 bacterium]NIU23262.1 hypothetical protein [candidate division KSB1 bacterium]
MKSRTSSLVVMTTFMMLTMLIGCSDDSDVSPFGQTDNVTNELGAQVLSYSGVVVIGAPHIPWTSESGVLVFVVARNQSDEEWRGHPEAAAYTIDSNEKRGELVGSGEGVLTNFVNRDTFTPTDEVTFIPANDERETLTFIPVDFSVNPRVFVYWRFVDENNSNLSFKQVVSKAQAQSLTTLAEAKSLLGSL